ncbi:MAG: oligosaccharide flippase family protein [Gammaproteobacteria bacterium]
MINKFLKDSITYAIPALLARGIGLFLLPVYTRYLTPQDYGVIELLTILFALLNIIIPIEIAQAEARLLPDALDKLKKMQLASTAFWFTALGFVFIAIIIWKNSINLSVILFSSDQYGLELRIASVSMIANALFYVVQNHLRWCLQARESAIIGVIYSLFVAVISIYFVAVLKMGVIGILLGQLISGVLAIILGIYFSLLKIPISLNFNFSTLKEMLVFSTPLVFSSVAVYINTYIDRWLINSILDLNDVGIYSVAFRIALVPGLIMYTFQMALAPLIYHNYNDKKTPFNIARLFSYFLLIILPILAIIGVFADEILKLLTTEKFYSASELVLLLSMSMVLMNIYIFSPGLGIAKLTHRIAVINIIAASINIVLNIIMIPIYGRFGAAVATLVGSILMATLYFWQGNKKYKIPYDYSKCIIAILTLCAFLMIHKLISPAFTSTILLLTLFIISTFLILLSAIEKKTIINLVLDYVPKK